MSFGGYYFTERAHIAIEHAKSGAELLGHNYIGTEHILLGLVKEGNGFAAQILQENDVTSEKVIALIEQIIGRGSSIAGNVIEITPRVKSVFEIATSEARKNSNNYVGTEHLLIGILKEGESVAVAILSNLGIEPQKLLNDISKAMAEDSPGMGGFPKNARPRTNTPTLDQFGRDLTNMAENGKIDPVIGRDSEIIRVIQILSRRTKNNPCLIGEPGVGKTAIVEGLAQRIINSDVPELLKNQRVVTLDLSSMVAGAKYRGEFEERLKKSLEEIRTSGNVILFIDEMHTIVGAGAAEGAIDASNILKPLLARGEIQVIGATTISEYRKHIEKDAALERRFQPITVGEPSEEEAKQILQGLRDKYEAHHRVKISDEAIAMAVQASSRYITDRFLPDKAIDLIDEAASKKRLISSEPPVELKQIEEKIEKLKKEKECAIQNQDYEKAASIRDKEQGYKEELRNIKEDWNQKSRIKTDTVVSEDIAQIISQWTGIPVSELTKEESQRLLDMEKILHTRVIGQEEAVTAVSKSIRRGRAGLKDPKRPIGSFIFLGPTGVGKTELCKALAEALFGDENAMIRVDMSEYMEKHSVSKLVGSPPGYVGYEEGGQLTEKVRRKPYSVILFDEIEKAHYDVFNILLQIMEDGRLTDSQGRRVDFRNCVIIMTSNAGARLITDPKQLGFASAVQESSKDYESMKRNVMGELKHTFRPEFLNRVDDIIVFHMLDKSHIIDIVKLMINDLTKRLEKNNIHMEISDAVVEFISQNGFDRTYGARPLRRTIQNHIEDKLSEGILDGTFKFGDSVFVDVDDNTLIFKKNK